MQRDQALLLDIYSAGAAALSHINGFTFGEFEQDRKTQKAVICEILIMGEATKKLSKDFCSKHDGIPWASMAKSRDKLVHDYDQVQLDVLWNTVTKEIPAVLVKIAPLQDISQS